jgi:hypothetical protein
MKKILVLFFTFLFLNQGFALALTDVQIKKTLIKQSIAEYPGNCPCPYNYASNGSICGGRSAWSRGGGYSPLCYPSDVSKQMINNYKKTHK